MKDYPTNAELKKIRNWKIDTPGKLMALLDFLKERWQYGNCGYYELKGKKILQLRLSTAGWSENEDMIDALQKNDWFFWGLFWQKSKRGGHYFFKIDLKTFYPKMKK